jgi:SpoIID/LytB domain protein
MLRRTLILGLAALALGASPAAAGRFVAPAGSGALFLFSGHGYGHGVGMSQYGAYGYAQHGYTYDQILAHYFPGTKLGAAPTATIRVLLADGRKALTIASDQPIAVVDGTGATHTLAAGKTKLTAALQLPADGQAAVTLTPPLTFSATTGSTLTLGRPYRGQLVVDVVDGKLRAVNVVALESYLDGVVPAEMPPTWSPEALKAQAVASRSYALATRLLAAPYDVYADTRSQAYLGVKAETPATDAAVAATAGQVLWYGKKIATTFFSSTSGGETETASDVWGGVSPPYLVSVPDPYDTISPYHDWGPVPVTAQTIATQLKVPGAVVDAETTANPAGRVATLDVSSLAGAPPLETVTPIVGTTVQTKLGLRSTWFDVGVLSLLPPATPLVAYGTPVTITGLVRDVDGAVVEDRPSGSTWQDLGDAAPDADGNVSFDEDPQITTDYRLATPDAAAAYVRVKVMPLVTLSEATTTAVAGTEQPVLAGATVQIQQQSPVGVTPAWTTLATGTIDENGAFSVPVTLAAGATVRALVAPGHGYAPGPSAAATVDG